MAGAAQSSGGADERMPLRLRSRWPIGMAAESGGLRRIMAGMSRLSQKEVSQPLVEARRSVDVAGLPNAAEANATKSAACALENARLAEETGVVVLKRGRGSRQRRSVGCLEPRRMTSLDGEV
jgi:hypothetical protein